jgi:hypothetical protein
MRTFHNGVRNKVTTSYNYIATALITNVKGFVAGPTTV